MTARRRRWLPQFALRTLLLAVVAAAVALGYAKGEWLVATILAIVAVAVVEGPLSRDPI